MPVHALTSMFERMYICCSEVCAFVLSLMWHWKKWFAMEMRLDFQKWFVFVMILSRKHLKSPMCVNWNNPEHNSSVLQRRTTTRLLGVQLSSSNVFSVLCRSCFFCVCNWFVVFWREVCVSIMFEKFIFPTIRNFRLIETQRIWDFNQKFVDFSMKWKFRILGKWFVCLFLL